MVSKEDIVENFEEMNINIKDDLVLSKCAEICVEHDLTATDFVETWIAFAASTSTSGTPMLETLIKMEKKEFGKKADKRSVVQEVKSLPVYNPKSSDQLLETYSNLDGCGGDGGGGGGTPRSVRNVGNDINNGGCPRIFSPASFSPNTIAASTKYPERSNSGQVACSFGPCDKDNNDDGWMGSEDRKVTAVAFSGLGAPHDMAYMYETVGNKFCAMNERVERLSADICAKHGLQGDMADPRQISTESSVYTGMIACDCDGKLNPSSVVLETCGYNGFYGPAIPLDLKEVDEFCLFPGQVIVVEGTNPTGKVILVEKVYSEAHLPVCPIPVEFSKPGRNLHMIVVSGPFTLSDTLSYEPLEDLMKYILKHEPDVVFLIGPIVDSAHPHVVDGSMAEAFDDFHDRTLEGILKPLAKKKTKVIVASSWRESGGSILYPTPPPNKSELLKKYPNLSLTGDPSIFSVDGFCIGATSVDVLKHLAKEEISRASAPKMDRLSLLTLKAMGQKSFYPLVPPSDELALDLNLAKKHASLPIKPHMLILPSDLRHFIKVVEGCIILNPERLAKGQIGGNFARIEVRCALEGESWTAETHVAVQVLKI